MKSKNKIGVFIIFFHFLFAGLASGKDKNEAIHWMTIEEAEAKMKMQPRFILIDMYTNWCGWCRKMDKETYDNPFVGQYINEHYYPVKLNAETRDSLTFQGKKWGFQPDKRVNELAYQLAFGKLSYPTTVICSPDMKVVNPIAGYMDVNMMEMILTFFGDNKYKTVKWDDYRHDFVYHWKP